MNLKRLKQFIPMRKQPGRVVELEELKKKKARRERETSPFKRKFLDIPWAFQPGARVKKVEELPNDYTGEPMTRRQFLKKAAKAGLSLGIAGVISRRILEEKKLSDELFREAVQKYSREYVKQGLKHSAYFGALHAVMAESGVAHADAKKNLLVLDKLAQEINLHPWRVTQALSGLSMKTKTG